MIWPLLICSLDNFQVHHTTVSHLFNDSYSNRCEVIFSCDLICIFLMTSDVPNVPVGHLYVFVKMFIFSSSVFIQTRFLFCFVSFGYWVLYIFWILIPYRTHDLQIFFCFSNLPDDKISQNVIYLLNAYFWLLREIGM